MTTQEKIECVELAEKIKSTRPDLASNFPKTEWASMGNYVKAYLLMWVRTGKEPTCSPTCCKNVSRFNLEGVTITPTYLHPKECFKYMEQTQSIHYHDVSQVK